LTKLDTIQTLLAKLVSYDTTSLQSNMDLIQFIQDYLQSYGVSSILAPSEDGERANLYATIGPEDKRGVLLSGHTDVVPVAGQKWDSNPYKLTSIGERLYGRGTTDMKGFIAAVLAWIPAFVKQSLSTPIHLAFSYDEEIGCIGVRRLLDLMKDMPILPAMCIVGEPTSMKVVNGHKGKLDQLVTVTGLAAHSSLPHIGVNAIDYAAQLIVFINNLQKEVTKSGPFDKEYGVPYTTLHTGTIAGGTALNIVPNQCTFQFEIRNLPSQAPQHLLNRIHDYASQELIPAMQAKNRPASEVCTITFETLGYISGLFTPADATVIRFVQSLTDIQGIGKINYGTEGGLFSQQLKIPTVICGPGNMDQGHQPNEYIEISELVKMDTFMGRLLDAII